MLKIIKNTANWILNHLPGRSYIVFESSPTYADNSRAVFDEMIRRNYQKMFKFIWFVNKPVAPDFKVEHAEFFLYPAENWYQKLRQNWIMLTAKAFISCNNVLPWYRQDQYALCLMHGAPMKDVYRHFRLPEKLDEIVGFSSYLMPIESKCHNFPLENSRLLGFPRNDILFTTDVDVHKLFPDVEFSKLIYWMPTYRQHENSELNLSDIAIPIIYNEEIAQEVNACAAENGVLVVLKPHPVQDLSRVQNMNLSHLKIISNKFLDEKGVLNYALMGKSDALFTDYSSTYYDYLLLDRPIGLCWDDYEEYSKREGFVVDMDVVMAAGEKLYTSDDMCGFITRLARGEDVLSAQRRQVIDMIHDYQDGNSTQRVVDYIAKKLHIAE